MKRQLLLLVLVGCLGLNGCASYNEHIKACHGQETSTAHLVLDYLPIGAIVDNGYCAAKASSS
ncbi:hypothetical protein KXR87_01015 [Yokenella regensburgei]|uniref:hypothetical protein n=1 Tax=Yokenella regensburgei TaxID=158877 RepID=UPI003F17AE66